MIEKLNYILDAKKVSVRAWVLSSKTLWTKVKVVSLVMFNQAADVDIYFDLEDDLITLFYGQFFTQ